MSKRFLILVIALFSSPSNARERVACGAFRAAEMGPLMCDAGAMRNAAEPWNRGITLEARQKLFACQPEKDNQLAVRRSFYLTHRQDIERLAIHFRFNGASDADWTKVMFELCPLTAENNHAPHP